LGDEAALMIIFLATDGRGGHSNRHLFYTLSIKTSTGNMTLVSSKGGGARLPATTARQTHESTRVFTRTRPSRRSKLKSFTGKCTTLYVVHKPRPSRLSPPTPLVNSGEGFLSALHRPRRRSFAHEDLYDPITNSQLDSS